MIGLHAADLWTKKLGVHIVAYRAYRELYYANRHQSELESTNVLTIIHDKMIT
jgi:hypothetical protein